MLLRSGIPGKAHAVTAPVTSMLLAGGSRLPSLLEALVPVLVDQQLASQVQHPTCVLPEQKRQL